MARIEVKKIEEFPKATFEVLVHNTTTTTHRVTMTKEYYESLTGGKIPPEDFVVQSFQFLLEREPNTSILPTFALPTIGSYFPEFEEKIRRGL